MPAEGEAGVLPGPGVPGPRADHEHRQRDRGSGGELPLPALLRREPAVGQHRPALGRGHGQRDRRLEVVLVEAGEDPLADVHPDVRRHVRLAVGGVGEGVHPVAVRHVRDPGLDGHGVVGGQPLERDPDPVVRRRGEPVDQHLAGVGELEERARARFATAEPDLGADPEGVPVGEVEVEPVGDVGEEGGPRPGLGEGQRHARDPRARLPVGCRLPWAPIRGPGGH